MASRGFTTSSWDSAARRRSTSAFRSAPTNAAGADDYAGVADTWRIDRTLHSLHSLFGPSKGAADLVVKEYGRYLSMKVGSSRGGCLNALLEEIFALQRAQLAE